MIQITPQMRILVAVEPVDGRKGIDSRHSCARRIANRPFLGVVVVFRSRRGTAIRILVYDGQDSGSHRSGYPRGVFAGGRKAGIRARWRGVWQRINCKCCWRRATRRPPRRRRRAAGERVSEKNGARGLRSYFVSVTLGGMEESFATGAESSPRRKWNLSVS